MLVGAAAKKKTRKKKRPSKERWLFDPNWDTTPFVKGMPFTKFLTVMLQPKYAAVIVREVRLSKNRDPKSAWSTIDMVYSLGVTVECETFSTCLMLVLVTQLSYQNYKEVYQLLAKLKPYLFPDDAQAATEKSWGTKVNTAFLAATFMSALSEKQARNFQADFEGRKKLGLSTLRKFQVHKRATDNREASLLHQTQLSEATVTTAIAKAIEEAEGLDMAAQDLIEEATRLT